MGGSICGAGSTFSLSCLAASPAFFFGGDFERDAPKGLAGSLVVLGAAAEDRGCLEGGFAVAAALGGEPFVAGGLEEAGLEAAGLGGMIVSDHRPFRTIPSRIAIGHLLGIMMVR